MSINIQMFGIVSLSVRFAIPSRSSLTMCVLGAAGIIGNGRLAVKSNELCNWKGGRVHNYTCCTWVMSVNEDIMRASWNVYETRFRGCFDVDLYFSGTFSRSAVICVGRWMMIQGCRHICGGKCLHCLRLSKWRFRSWRLSAVTFKGRCANVKVRAIRLTAWPEIWVFPFISYHDLWWTQSDHRSISPSHFALQGVHPGWLTLLHSNLMRVWN